ncbi:MAG TPA: ATP-binding protein [Fimbriimonadaceae bacterium]|nr:ATP-binding protein [Fimbriimonadaceae bacterium]
MNDPSLSTRERLLVLAPVGRDAALIQEMAKRRSLPSRGFRSVGEFVRAFEAGVGAVVLTEEALALPDIPQVFQLVEDQEPWSDVPFLVLVSRSHDSASRTLRLTEYLRNVTLMERPVRPRMVLSAFDTMLRDRRRQYAVRDLLDSLMESERRYRELATELEKRVALRTKELSEAITEMEGFTYNVSHDLRAPLRAIVSTSRMLREDYSELLPPPVQEELGRQERAANKLASVIDELLKLSRISRQAMSRTSVNLSQLAWQVIEDLRAGAEDGLRDFKFTVHDGLNCQADPTLIRLVLDNLIGNAIKFSPDGGVIEIGELSVDGSCVYFVRDEGVGFDMRYVNKAFMPFERLVSDSDFPGTGVGLANVQRIVRRHGGAVWASSRIGEGSTFFFTLPDEAIVDEWAHRDTECEDNAVAASHAQELIESS